MSKQSSPSGVVSFLLIIIGCYFLYLTIMYAGKICSFLGYNMIFFLDNLFSVSAFYPIVIWSIWGLIIGALIGVLVAIKKYRLSKVLLLYPLCLLLLSVTIMSFINSPSNHFGTYAPKVINNKQPISKKNYYILISDANVRTGPSLKNSKLYSLKKGIEVEVVNVGFMDSRKVEWYQIKYNGQLGFVSSKLLRFSRQY